MGRISRDDTWPALCGAGSEDGRESAVELLEELLEVGSELRIRVTGQSMAPSLEGGEFVHIRREPVKRLSRGDLLLFRDDRGFLVLHRLVGKAKKGGKALLKTRGDALGRADEPVEPSQVLGRVCAISDEEGGKNRDLKKLRFRLAGRALGVLQGMRPFRALRRALAARYGSGKKKPSED